ncbi:hypothetical protein [Gluconacetobacter diazotrophicus]|uniref:hypothetical protein n=1 Tax=Gluconacetobacter diazotrophicus TaxID=33996 RepID=UPI001FCDBF14|nr:hypothetical protein [Gluconacetobacter diazotrophicus]
MPKSNNRNGLPFGVMLMLLAGLAACTVKRPEGDSIDVPPTGLFSGAPRPDATSPGKAGAARPGRPDNAGDLAARQPDYRPLPDAPGMQMISSGFDSNASDDDAEKEDGKHYVIPDTQVSYGARGTRQGQPAAGQ